MKAPGGSIIPYRREEADEKREKLESQKKIINKKDLALKIAKAPRAGIKHQNGGKE